MDWMEGGAACECRQFTYVSHPWMFRVSSTQESLVTEENRLVSGGGRV